MDYKDYYGILGVSKKADADEIQKKYRKLARKYHPDVNKTPKAEAKFKEINETYEVLKDPEKRARYDQFGSAWKQTQRTGAPPPGFEDIFAAFTGGSGGPGGGGVRGFKVGGGEGFSSFFEMLFGGGPGGPGTGAAGPGGPGTGAGWAGGRGPWEPASARGRDHEARLALSLEEAARGGTKRIELTDPATGQRTKFRVRIPPGVRPGQRIRLRGKGGEGTGGKNRGDLFLVIEFLPHPVFRLEGDDLHTVLNVAPWEAAMGGKAAVGTLDGDVTVRIPPGTSSGRKIRLRDRGFPTRNGTTGDLLAEVRIVVPDRLTERETELFGSLADESEFEPRS